MSDPVTKDSQLAQLREWIISAGGRRAYRLNDKRRYAVLGYDGQEVLMTLDEAEQWLRDSEESYTLADRWMTPKQYENLPEFEGF